MIDMVMRQYKKSNDISDHDIYERSALSRGWYSGTSSTSTSITEGMINKLRGMKWHVQHT